MQRGAALLLLAQRSTERQSATECPCSSIATVAGRSPVLPTLLRCDSGGARVPSDDEVARADVVPMHRVRQAWSRGASVGRPERQPARGVSGRPHPVRPISCRFTLCLFRTRARTSAMSYSATDTESIAARCLFRGPLRRKVLTASCDRQRSNRLTRPGSSESAVMAKSRQPSAWRAFSTTLMEPARYDSRCSGSTVTCPATMTMAYATMNV